MGEKLSDYVRFLKGDTTIELSKISKYIQKPILYRGSCDEEIDLANYNKALRRKLNTEFTLVHIFKPYDNLNILQ